MRARVYTRVAARRRVRDCVTVLACTLVAGARRRSQLQQRCDMCGRARSDVMGDCDDGAVACRSACGRVTVRGGGGVVGEYAEGEDYDDLPDLVPEATLAAAGAPAAVGRSPAAVGRAIVAPLSRAPVPAAAAAAPMQGATTAPGGGGAAAAVEPAPAAGRSSSPVAYTSAVTLAQPVAAPAEVPVVSPALEEAAAPEAASGCAGVHNAQPHFPCIPALAPASFAYGHAVLPVGLEARIIDAMRLAPLTATPRMIREVRACMAAWSVLARAPRRRSSGRWD